MGQSGYLKVVLWLNERFKREWDEGLSSVKSCKFPWIKMIEIEIGKATHRHLLGTWLINLAFLLVWSFGEARRECSGMKLTLLFLRMHMEMPGKGFAINIDSMSEAQHWLHWKSLAGVCVGISWSFHLERVKVQAHIIDFGGDIEGICWGLWSLTSHLLWRQLCVPLRLCLTYFVLKKRAMFAVEAAELPALSLFM